MSEKENIQRDEAKQVIADCEASRLAEMEALQELKAAAHAIGEDRMNNPLMDDWLRKFDALCEKIVASETRMDEIAREILAMAK